MISKLGSSICVCILISLFVIDSGSSEKDIPHSKLSQNVGGPTMTFLYCYSCGYRKAYEEYANIIQERFPDITLKGDNYEPSGINFLLSKAILAAKLVFILIIVSSYDIWAQFGQSVPRWYQWCTENKIYACMMVFFVGNMLEAQLVSSGAFEISFNDIPVWSKLETGRIPSPQELFSIINSHMKMFSNSNKLQDFNE